MLMLLAGVRSRSDALVPTALVRAHALARAVPERQRPPAFCVGLLSVVDAMLGLEMRDALDGLPLSDEIRHALTRHQGRIGGLPAELVTDERDAPVLASILWSEDRLSAYAACGDQPTAGASLARG